jgi:hypothetical protein
MLNSDCDRIPDRCFAPGPLLPSKTGLLLVSGSGLADTLGVRLATLFNKPRTKQPGPGRPKKRTRELKTKAR